jgi:uncharacterized protein (TIGR02246 family)
MVLQENFAAWNNALLSLDAKKVAALYAPKDLSFLPTLSPDMIRDNVAAHTYFIGLLKKTPEAKISADDIQAFGSDAYLHTGLYTFYLGPDRTPVQARFSYLWKKTNDAWIITHHHSSVLPAAP